MTGTQPHSHERLIASQGKTELSGPYFSENRKFGYKSGNRLILIVVKFHSNYFAAKI